MAALARAWQKPRGFWVDVAPALLYFAALFWFGLTPLKKLPGPDFALVDKVWHAGAFAGLSVLLSRALVYARRPPPSAARAGAWCSVALGGLLEVLQSFTAYRSADVADFVADGLGAALAYWLLRGLYQAARAEPQAG